MKAGLPKRQLLRVVSVLLLAQAVLRMGADDRILISAKLNDQPIRLAFDTGAGDVVIFSHVAAQRGLHVDPPPADARPTGGEIPTGRTELVKFELLGQLLPDMHLRVIDAPPAIPSDIEGFASWSNVRNNVWTITGGRDLVMTWVMEPPAGLDRWIRARELPDLGILSVEFPAAGSAPPVRLGFDTGSDHGVALAPAEWTRWRASHRNMPVTLEAYYMALAGLVVTEEAWAEEINVGGLLLRQVPVRPMNASEVASQPPGTIAVIGLFGLRRLDAVLDGKSHAMYFRPHAALDLSYQHNRLGAVFTPDTLETVELHAHVAPGNPAARADIREGDVLLKIDDLDVRPWRTQPGILPLRRFFVRPAGTRMRLTIQRGDKVLAKDIGLSDILGRTK